MIASYVIVAGKRTTMTSGRIAVTRPRAADDFPMIRSRMVELRRERVGGTMTQPRVADAIATIRPTRRSACRLGPRPYHRGATGHAEDHRDRLLPAFNSSCAHPVVGRWRFRRKHATLMMR